MPVTRREWTATEVACGAMVCAAIVLACGPAFAQGLHNPFNVGAGEGAVGRQNALGAWLLAQESRFYLGLTHAVRATGASVWGLLGLVGLSFAYGIFHAAGPGHGKAVITSYMVSNEVALRRGLAIALAAALLQGLIATLLVGIAALVFHATASRMTAAAQAIEFFSYVCIVTLGLFLCWRKGWALIATVWPDATQTSLVFAATVPQAPAWSAASTSSRFRADSGDDLCIEDDCSCGGLHMPDPGTLRGPHLDRRAAALAIFTAGARPCSGAILVLVFALSQGLFAAGIAATFAMSLGTAITTGLLAITAVYAKDLAVRLSGRATLRARVIGRLVEFAAAACVLVFGLILLTAWLSGLRAGAWLGNGG